MIKENYELRIREIEKLKEGWNFGKGKSFSHEHVEVCAQLANRYYKKYSLSVSGTPSVDGSIDLLYNKNDHFLEIKILPSINESSVRYSKGIGKNRIEEAWGTMPLAKLDILMDKFYIITSDQNS